MDYVVRAVRFTARPALMTDFCAALGLRPVRYTGSDPVVVFAGRSGELGLRAVPDGGTDGGTDGGAEVVRTTVELLVTDVAAAARALAESGLALSAETPGGAPVRLTSPSGLIVTLAERGSEELDPEPGRRSLASGLEQTVAASMDLVAVCTVPDVDREADFFAHVGFVALEDGAGYLPLTAAAGAGVIGLRPSADRPGRVELGAETSEPFDALADRLRVGGYPAETVEDESGIRVRIVDPDGASLEVRPTR